MPTPTFTPGDNKQDEKLNPNQQDYDRRFNNVVAQSSEYPDVEKGLRDAESFANTSSASSRDEASLNELEQEPEEQSTYQNNYTGNAKKKVELTAKVLLRRGGPIAGIGGIIGMILFLLGGWLPTMLIPNLSQNAVINNDVKGTLLERRLVQAISQKMADKTGPCVTKSSLCLSNKMPKVMLSSMASQGIVPVDADGKAITDLSGNGYVDTNPDGYEFTDKDGKKRIVKSDDFLQEYKNNSNFRNTFKKSYNTRWLAYTGKNFTKILTTLGLKKNGGSVNDADLTKDNVTKKITTPVNSIDESESATKSKFRDRAKSLFTRAGDKVKKTGGDPVLMVGTGACMAVNTPGFVAGTWRALQFAQVAAITWNTILSPGDAIRSGTASSGAVAALGGALTNTYRGSDGKFGKSAVDSSILQSAVGVNKNKVKLSKLVPGYSLFSSPLVQSANTLSKETKEACQTINSPEAALASAGISGAIAAGSGGIGAIVIGALKAVGKLAIAFGAIDIALNALSDAGVFDLIADLAFGLMGDAIGNIYTDIQGEELGDALGIGIFAFFSVAALGSGAAVLKRSQIARFNAVMNEVDDEYKQEALATLSPFDISSRYTFMGSIVSNLALTTSLTTNPVSNTFSVLGGIMKLPLNNLSSSVSAADGDISAKCDYGELFDISEEICMNPAGYPVVGIPAEYIDLPRQTVQQQVIDSIDEETGEPLALTNEIGNFFEGNPDKNNDISSMLADCSEGDLDSLAGCTIDSLESTGTVAVNECEKSDTGYECSSSTTSATISSDVTALKRASQSLYVLDREVEAILSGTNDPEDTEKTESSIISSDYVLPVKPGYKKFSENKDWGKRNICTSSNPNSFCYFHRGVDFSDYSDGSIGKPVYAVAAGKVVIAETPNGNKNLDTCAGGLSEGAYSTNNPVHILHADGTIGVYLHMGPGSISVKPGDMVKAGQQIGKINNCGQSGGPHLHFGIIKGTAKDERINAITTNTEGSWTYINPVAYMRLYGVDIENGVYIDGR